MLIPRKKMEKTEFWVRDKQLQGVVRYERRYEKNIAGNA